MSENRSENEMSTNSCNNEEINPHPPSQETSPQKRLPISPNNNNKKRKSEILLPDTKLTSKSSSSIPIGIAIAWQRDSVIANSPPVDSPLNNNNKISCSSLNTEKTEKVDKKSKNPRQSPLIPGKNHTTTHSESHKSQVLSKSFEKLANSNEMSKGNLNGVKGKKNEREVESSGARSPYQSSFHPYYPLLAQNSTISNISTSPAPYEPYGGSYGAEWASQIIVPSSPQSYNNATMAAYMQQLSILPEQLQSPNYANYLASNFYNYSSSQLTNYEHQFLRAPPPNIKVLSEEEQARVRAFYEYEIFMRQREILLSSSPHRINVPSPSPTSFISPHSYNLSTPTLSPRSLASSTPSPIHLKSNSSFISPASPFFPLSPLATEGARSESGELLRNVRNNEMLRNSAEGADFFKNETVRNEPMKSEGRDFTIIEPIRNEGRSFVGKEPMRSDGREFFKNEPMRSERVAFLKNDSMRWDVRESLKSETMRSCSNETEIKKHEKINENDKLVNKLKKSTKRTEIVKSEEDLSVRSDKMENLTISKREVDKNGNNELVSPVRIDFDFRHMGSLDKRGETEHESKKVKNDEPVFVPETAVTESKDAKSSVNLSIKEEKTKEIGVKKKAEKLSKEERLKKRLEKLRNCEEKAKVKAEKARAKKVEKSKSIKITQKLQMRGENDESNLEVDERVSEKLEEVVKVEALCDKRPDGADFKFPKIVITGEESHLSLLATVAQEIGPYISNRPRNIENLHQFIQIQQSVSCPSSPPLKTSSRRLSDSLLLNDSLLQELKNTHFETKKSNFSDEDCQNEARKKSLGDSEVRSFEKFIKSEAESVNFSNVDEQSHEKTICQDLSINRVKPLNLEFKSKAFSSETVTNLIKTENFKESSLKQEHKIFPIRPVPIKREKVERRIIISSSSSSEPEAKNSSLNRVPDPSVYDFDFEEQKQESFRKFEKISSSSRPYLNLNSSKKVKNESEPQPLDLKVSSSPLKPDKKTKDATKGKNKTSKPKKREKLHKTHKKLPIFEEESIKKEKVEPEDEFSTSAWTANPTLAVKAVKITEPDKKYKKSQLLSPKSPSRYREKKRKIHHFRPCLKAEIVSKSEQSEDETSSEELLDLDLNFSCQIKPNSPISCPSQPIEKSKNPKTLSIRKPSIDMNIFSRRVRSSEEERDERQKDKLGRDENYVWDKNIKILNVSEMVDEMRILTEIQGLFYTGKLNALQPPDVYGVTLDNERGAPPHMIFSAEEVIEKCVREAKPWKPSQLPHGLRICAYWSPMYSGLYPGKVSTDYDCYSDLVPVEFDDGDTGVIKIREIRLLAPDHPIREYDPNPLLTLEKKQRKRRHSSAGVSLSGCSGEHEEDDCGEAYCAKIAKLEDEKEEESEEEPVLKYWTWTGLGYKLPKTKQNRHKEFFNGIQRGEEVINVGDSAIFISNERNERPFLGRVEKFWEKKGHKSVTVRWFYHPEEVKTPKGKKMQNFKYPGALFESSHIDDNDVQSIAKKCEVLPFEEFKEKYSQHFNGGAQAAGGKINPKKNPLKGIYYLAGFYDPYNFQLKMKDLK